MKYGFNTLTCIWWWWECVYFILLSLSNRLSIINHWLGLRNETMVYAVCPIVFHSSTDWGRVTQIYVRKLTTIGSDNGLSPGRRQAIIWTNAGILLIDPFGTDYSEILIEIYIFSFKKMHAKLSSGDWRPYFLGLNVLKRIGHNHVYARN